jgi:hypothetical protein
MTRKCPEMPLLRARKRITSRDVVTEKDLLSLFNNSGKLLRASTGKNGYVVMPVEFGRRKLFFDKS